MKKKRRFIWWDFNFDNSEQDAKRKKIGNTNNGAKPQGYDKQEAYPEEDSPTTMTLTGGTVARGSVGTVEKFFQLGDEVVVKASNKAGKIIEIKNNNPKPYVIDTGQGEKISDLSANDLDLIKRGDQGYQGVTGRDFLGARTGIQAGARDFGRENDVLLQLAQLAGRQDVVQFINSQARSQPTSLATGRDTSVSTDTSGARPSPLLGGRTVEENQDLLKKIPDNPFPPNRTTIDFGDFGMG